MRKVYRTILTASGESLNAAERFKRDGQHFSHDDAVVSLSECEQILCSARLLKITQNTRDIIRNITLVPAVK